MPTHYVIITRLLTPRTGICGKGSFIRKKHFIYLSILMNNVLKGFQKDILLEALHIHW